MPSSLARIFKKLGPVLSSLASIKERRSRICNRTTSSGCLTTWRIWTRISAKRWSRNDSGSPQFAGSTGDVKTDSAANFGVYVGSSRSRRCWPTIQCSKLKWSWPTKYVSLESSKWLTCKRSLAGCSNA